MAFLFGLIGCGNLDPEARRNIRDNHLTRFTNSDGGSMTGDHHSVNVIALEDGRALLSFSDAEWYFQDPTVREYLVSDEILTELETVFRKYNMQRWHNREFTKDFICDGGTESYSFYFGSYFSDVHFSSQIYPAPYRNKLHEFSEIIARYRSDGKLLPGLVLPERTDEEIAEHRQADDGRVSLDVCEYSLGTLYIRLINGTDSELTVSGAYRLYKAGSDTPIAQTERGYEKTVSEHSSSEESLKPAARLEAGTYVLKLDGSDLQCVFEIK